MMTDFDEFIRIGSALWAGQYVGLYPLPMNGAFAALAMLPAPSARAAMLSISLVCLVASLKRDALLWCLYQPILATCLAGQVDLIALWLLRHGSPVSLALLTLKPQLFILAVPTLWRDRSMWKPFAISCAALYLPVTAVRPTWVIEWITAMNDGRLDGAMTSFLQVPAIAFVVLIALAVTSRLTIKRIFWCFNPTLRWYDLTMRAGETRWLIPASWVAFGVTQVVGGQPWPLAMVGLL